MNISLLSYLISTVITLFFVFKISQAQKIQKNKVSKDFFAFFLFGALYFLTRTVSLIFFMDFPKVLAYSYPISHIFLYLSFIFMLDLAIRTSKYRKLSKYAKIVWVFVGSIILILNFIFINKPVLNNALVDWGTHGVVKVLHPVFTLLSVLIVASIFLYQSFKDKTLSKKYLLIAIGFGIMPLSVFKHLFENTFVIYLFEFNMILGITIIASGLLLEEKSTAEIGNE